MVTRTISIQITGSLANFAMAGTQAAVWKPVDGKQAMVFGCLGENMDSTLATNQLRTALIHEMKVLEHKSTFPITVGVKINCIPASEFTDLGEGFAYTILPHSVINTPHTIYTCDERMENGQSWRNEYPKWNSTNLETEGVMDVANCPYVFVHQDHPIIALLRSNSALIGCNIDEQPKIDNEWFKVTRQVLAACCQTLRQKVLSKIASNDLNTLQVQLVRPNAEGWDDVTDANLPLQDFVPNPTWTPEAVDQAKRMHVERFLALPFSYHARIQLKYEVQTPN
jgi:hypothetical protein